MSRARLVPWTPATLMCLAALFTVGLDLQRPVALRQPLGSVVPAEISGYVATDVVLPEAEIRAAGVTDYLMRIYESADTTQEGWFSLYIGYYDQQRRGQTIHSPKNCLPGSGWEPLTSTTAEVASGGGTFAINRYLLQRRDEQVLVLYWYQGRGRVQANEYLVKWDLLRDSALHGRSDEALVRLVIPIFESTDDAFERGVVAAGEILASVGHALPQ